MDKEIIEIKIVAIVGEYGIQKCKERYLDYEGKPYGRIHTWFDVCLENGNGDIVESFRTLIEAKKWAKENSNG